MIKSQLCLFKQVKKTRMNLVNTLSSIEVASPHYRKILWYYSKNYINIINYSYFLVSIKYALVEINKVWNVYPNKVNLKLKLIYNIPHKDNSDENRVFMISSRKVFMYTDIEKIINKELSCLLLDEDTYMNRGIGFCLHKIGSCILIHQ